MNADREPGMACQDPGRFDCFGFGARPNGRELASIVQRRKSPHAMDTRVRQMPPGNGCAGVNHNIRVGDEIGNAHADLHKRCQRSRKRH